MSSFGHVADMIGRMKANNDIRKRDKYGTNPSNQKHLAIKLDSKETYPELTPEGKDAIRMKHQKIKRYNKIITVVLVLLTIILSALSFYLLRKILFPSL